MYWMVECAMMNKYEYMKMITNMAKLCIFIKSRVKTEQAFVYTTSSGLLPAPVDTRLLAKWCICDMRLHGGGTMTGIRKYTQVRADWLSVVSTLDARQSTQLTLGECIKRSDIKRLFLFTLERISQQIVCQHSKKVESASKTGIASR